MSHPGVAAAIVAVLLLPLVPAVAVSGSTGPPGSERALNEAPGSWGNLPAPRADAVANLSSSVQRLVAVVGVAGGGLLTLVWVRVALSWFSSDVTKKIQAKDRARDALVGTLIFVAALSGLAWGLAHWIVTGS